MNNLLISNEEIKAELDRQFTEARIYNPSVSGYAEDIFSQGFRSGCHFVQDNNIDCIISKVIRAFFMDIESEITELQDFDNNADARLKLIETVKTNLSNMKNE